MEPDATPDLPTRVARLTARLALLEELSAEHLGLVHELEPDPAWLLAQATPEPSLWERLRGVRPRPGGLPIRGP